MGIFFVDRNQFEVEGPSHFEETGIPKGPLIFNKLLGCAGGILTLVNGLLMRRTVKNPTRTATWKLFKKTALIIVLQFVLLVLTFVTVSLAIGMAIENWERNQNRENGEYTFTNTYTNEKVKHIKKPHNRPEISEADEESIALLFTSIFSVFVLICCCATACSACTLGVLYKFHVVTKELEIIQDLPSVRQMNLQRGVPQQMPYYQYRPEPMSSNVVRGQVIMMPSVQS